MKKLLVFVCFFILLPISAHAGDHTRFPAIQINGVFYSVDCLCVDGDKLRHQDESKDAVRPILMAESVCTKWDPHPEKGGHCLQWETHESACPLTYIIKMFDMDGETERLVGTESYTIPKCESR